MRVVVLDLETTGVDPRVDRILEVGMVCLVDGEKAAEYQILVDPGVPLRPSNVAIHGITGDMVRGAPRLDEVLEDILAFMGEDPYVVGHNVAFDIAFLDAALRELRGTAFSPRSLDTQIWAREVFPGERALSVERLVQLFGLSHEGYHRALNDARALAAVYPLLERAWLDRMAVYRGRFAEVRAVASELLDVQGELERLKIMEFTLRRILELYLEESGDETVEIPGRVRFRLERRENVGYHAEELKELLAGAGLLARVAKVDRDKLDRLLRSDRLSPAQLDAIARTRRTLSFRRQLIADRLDPEVRSWPTMPSPT